MIDRHIKTSAHKQKALVLSFDMEQQLDEVITDEQPGLSVDNSPNEDCFEVDEHLHSGRPVSILAKGYYTIITKSPTGIGTICFQQ